MGERRKTSILFPFAFLGVHLGGVISLGSSFCHNLAVLVVCGGGIKFRNSYTSPVGKIDVERFGCL